MKNFTSFLVACFLAIFNLSAQDTINSVAFSGETPEYAIVGGKAILDVAINIADTVPANLMVGIIKLDAEGNPDVQPVAMKIISLSDVAPYSKQVTDTISVPAELTLSSALTDGEIYSYFCTLLTSAFSPIDQKYSEVTVVDISVGNQVDFSTSPYGTVMTDCKVALNVDLTITDTVPANLMVGLIKLDAEGNPDVQPAAMKIIPLSDVAPYSKHVIDTVSVSAELALSSALTDGETYAYFCTLLTSAFSPIKQKYSDVTVVEKANSVTFSSEPEGSAAPGDTILISLDLTIADTVPANLMMGIIKMDAEGNPGNQPEVMRIISLSNIAPYSKQVSDTVFIPADLALSSTLTNGETYAYFCSLLTPAFSPIDQKYSTVIIDVTSVHYYITNSIRIYPNPASNRIFITGYQPNEQVGIYDVAGTLLINIVLLSNEIDVSGLNSGVYLIKGESFISKFIKQ